jgi:polyphosphate kinase
VPRVLPRLIRMPAKVAGRKTLFRVAVQRDPRPPARPVSGAHVGQFSQFRVTRHSDLAVDEDDVKNLRTALRQGLQHRHYGQAVRLEVSAGCSDYTCRTFCSSSLICPRPRCTGCTGPVNLVRLTQLIDLVDEPAVFPALQSHVPQCDGAGAELL